MLYNIPANARWLAACYSAIHKVVIITPCDYFKYQQGILGGLLDDKALSGKEGTKLKGINYVNPSNFSF